MYIKEKTTPQYYFATYFFANDILMVFAHYLLFVCQNILIGLNVITLKITSFFTYLLSVELEYGRQILFHLLHFLQETCPENKYRNKNVIY